RRRRSSGARPSSHAALASSVAQPQPVSASTPPPPAVALSGEAPLLPSELDPGAPPVVGASPVVGSSPGSHCEVSNVQSSLHPSAQPEKSRSSHVFPARSFWSQSSSPPTTPSPQIAGHGAGIASHASPP